MQETPVQFLGREDALVEGMATHSSILAQRIPTDKKSLAVCSPWGHKELNTTERLSGEGNGFPLQYSCLENPMDGGAWWAAVHGLA